MTFVDDYFERWVESPPSQEIADILNAMGATECMHETSVCYDRCGVRLTSAESTFGPPRWRVLSSHERRTWLEHIAAMHKRSTP